MIFAKFEKMLNRRKGNLIDEVIAEIYIGQIAEEQNRISSAVLIGKNVLFTGSACSDVSVK